MRKMILTEKNKELLDTLKANMIRDFTNMERPDIVDVLKEFNYNDLIMVLHLGFSEKTFFRSLRGLEKNVSFYLSNEQLNKIASRLRSLKGRT